MFRHEGPARDPRKNATLAGYLALVAGFVNSAGVILIGSFTSHVTGSVGRFSTDLAKGDLAAAVSALSLAAIFFVGAFMASVIIEGAAIDRKAKGYAFALSVEGLTLALFVVSGVSKAVHPRVHDAQAALLCLAMGMQNSLVTRLSGSVVRTTHLTGVVTDLGIEAARWYRWYRRTLRLPLTAPLATLPPAERPTVERAVLLFVITLAFTFGAAIGAGLASLWKHWAMLLPAVAVLLASAVAYRQRDAA